MSTRPRAIEISGEGIVTQQDGVAINCPVREKGCKNRCAWYSNDGTASRCRDTVMGVVAGRKVVRSFRLNT